MAKRKKTGPRPHWTRTPAGKRKLTLARRKRELNKKILAMKDSVATQRKVVIADTNITAQIRDDQYASVARAAVHNHETDKVVRHLMAAGLAAGPFSGDLLGQDLTLLRWVLKKMEQNRKIATEIGIMDIRASEED
jgi:hypothetical protein